jgi:hypothetical protein
LLTDKRLRPSVSIITPHPDEGGHQAFLTATVTATRRTLANVGERCARELQNQWSASLAMSTDGSFPSRPRQSLNSWAKVTIAEDEKQLTNRHPE